MTKELRREPIEIAPEIVGRLDESGKPS